MFEEALASALVRCHLHEPDHRLDRLDLAEEGPEASEVVVPPVLEQPGRLRRHAPVARVADGPPLVHALPQLVDDRRGIVLLPGGRDAGAFVEDEPLLALRSLVLLRPGDRRDEPSLAAGLDDAPGRLPIGVQVPVAARVAVRRVEDRPLEEGAI